MRKQLTIVTLFALFALAVLETDASAQCRKDTDCKGDRICMKGTCTAPPAHKHAAHHHEHYARPLSPVLVSLQVGPAVGSWEGGGLFTMGLNVGNGGMRLASYFHFGFRLLGGAGMDNAAPIMIVGAIAAYRGMVRLASGMTPHFTVGMTYGHRWEWESPGATYKYHIPAFRMAGGISWGRGRRVTHGFEISLNPGYAFHYNVDENPYHEDYSGFYYLTDITYMVTF